MKKFHKNKMFYLLLPIIMLTLFLGYTHKNIPATIFVRDTNQYINNKFIKFVKETDHSAEASILGVFPIKTVEVKNIDKNIMLYPGGTPIGIKLNTEGVLVVALSDIETENGLFKSPATDAGIQVGDSILSVNGQKIMNSEGLSREINYLTGKEIKVEILRKNEKFDKVLVPIKSLRDDKYKIGLWVRDSTSGVGTVTFYDEKSNIFGALGHPITDVDTGTILNVRDGEIVDCNIISKRKGVKGNPGDLRGMFLKEDEPYGKITKNTESGIFGKSDDKIINEKFKEPLPIALKNEIKIGPAKILCTVEGTEPKFYDIMIDKLISQDYPNSKSMLIRVVDKELLEKTGGIVQGMSGSPIIQNGKIIGAVTHVLINKPEVGYGIYIEWMLEDSGILSES